MPAAYFANSVVTGFGPALYGVNELDEMTRRNTIIDLQ